MQLAFRVYEFLRALDPPPHVVYFTDWQVSRPNPKPKISVHP